MKDSVIHNKLDNLQFHSNIDNGKFLLVKIHPGGFGAEVSRRLLGLKIGYIFNRTVIFDYKEMLYENCFYPLGSLDFTQFSLKNIKKLNYHKNQKDKIVYFDFQEFIKNYKLKKYIENWTPNEFKKKENANYFLGQLMLRLVPLPEYKKYIDISFKRLNWQRPIIGCHIRRGGKNTESPYVPLRIYFYYLKKVVLKTGIKKIFITTDSSEIISKLPNIINSNYIYDNQEKRYNNANHKLVKNNKDIKKQETMTALKILIFLSNCDYLIGQINTHFTSLAAASLYSKNLENRTYFVNRNKKNVYLNNDPNLIFYCLDIVKKYSHLFLTKIVHLILPLIGKYKIYKRIKEFYYGRKLD